MDKTSYIAGVIYYMTEDQEVRMAAIQLLNGERTLKELEACPSMRNYTLRAKRSWKELERKSPHHIPQAIIDFVEAHIYSHQ